MDRGLGNFPPFVRPADGPMDDEHLSAVVYNAVRDAISYIDEELSNDRATATEYYQGKPFGNEEQGRSSAILTEVRDGIVGVLPSILRIVHGPEHTVEFIPRRADGVGMAEQATDYVRWVYEEDNNGFLVTHSVLKDGLLKRLGIAKWGIEDTQESRSTIYRGISRADIALLSAEPNAEISAAHPVGEDAFDVEITRLEPVGRMWVIPIPPDDFFWNREARSLHDAILVGHRARLTRGELVKMGVSEEDLEEYGAPVGMSTQTPEEIARRQPQISGIALDPEMGPENRRILYCEVYMTLDVHGTGIPELRRLRLLGNTYHPIVFKGQLTEPVDELPFAVFSPDPEPHAMIGGSWYDRLKDAQKINSQLLRTILDSGAVAAFPRIAYVDGQVSVADIMNNGIGAPIRMRQPGMVQPFTQEFTGEKLMPLLSFMQDVIERRTGNKDGAGSLDMDALQSTGAQAVNAAISAASAQPELLARLFAEQFLKPMFRGLLKLASSPKSKERILRLRGSYVPINPASFDPSMDVAVNVTLGSTDTAKKVAILRDVVADQSAILGQYGPDNPVVNIAMLRNAKAKILQLQGIRDVENYYKPVDPNWQPPPPAPPQPSPDELWMQTEKEMNSQKMMKELAIKQDELALKHQQLQADISFRDRELAIKEAEVFRTPDNSLDQYKVDSELSAREQERVTQEQLERERLDLERERQDRDFELKRYTVDVQAATSLQSAQIKAQTEQDALKQAALMDGESAESEKPEPAEKPEPVVVHVHPPQVNVAAPVIHNHPPKGRKKGKMTAPDGSEYTMETSDEEGD